MVADFEVLVREQGREAFVEAFRRLSKEDQAAIGRGERDRIAALAEVREPVMAGDDDIPF